MKLFRFAVAALAALSMSLGPAFAATNQLPAVQGPNGPVSADPVVQIGYDTITGLPCVVGKTTTCPGSGGGGGTASLAPFVVTGNGSLSVTTSSARVALPSVDTTVILSNNGSAPANCAFGNNTVVATTSNSIVFPGVARVFGSSGAADVACITANGTTTINIETGTGSPVFGFALDFSKTSITQGDTAVGSTFPLSPFSEGCDALTASPTAQTNGLVVGAACGETGKRIVLPYSIKENALSGAGSANNTTSATALTGMGAQGASIKIYITGTSCFRTDAGTTMTYATLNDGASTTVPVPAGSGSAIHYDPPLVVAANTAATFTPHDAVITEFCNATGFKGN